jgi:hypothetical protein
VSGLIHVDAGTLPAVVVVWCAGCPSWRETAPHRAEGWDVGADHLALAHDEPAAKAEQGLLRSRAQALSGQRHARREWVAPKTRAPR